MARQASANAKSYADKAHTAGKNADKIATQIESAGLAANKFADSMKLTAAEMTKIAQDTRDAIPELDELMEAEKRAQLMSWMRTWKDSWHEEHRRAAGRRVVDRLLQAIGEAVIGMVGGVWLVGLCEIGHPTDQTPVRDGLRPAPRGHQGDDQEPRLADPLDEWKNGEYAKALGMSVVDLATLDLPKIGKIAKGINRSRTGSPRRSPSCSPASC